MVDGATVTSAVNTAGVTVSTPIAWMIGLYAFIGVCVIIKAYYGFWKEWRNYRIKEKALIKAKAEAEAGQSLVSLAKEVNQQIQDLHTMVKDMNDSAKKAGL